MYVPASCVPRGAESRAAHTAQYLWVIAMFSVLSGGLEHDTDGALSGDAIWSHADPSAHVFLQLLGRAAYLVVVGSVRREPRWEPCSAWLRPGSVMAIVAVLLAFGILNSYPRLSIRLVWLWPCIPCCFALGHWFSAAVVLPFTGNSPLVSRRCCSRPA